MAWVIPCLGLVAPVPALMPSAGDRTPRRPGSPSCLNMAWFTNANYNFIDTLFQCVGDFITGYRTHLGGFERHHGCGVAVQSHELHFVGPTIFVQVNHGAHVTRLQSLVGNSRGQNHAIMLFNHSSLSQPGRICRRLSNINPSAWGAIGQGRLARPRTRICVGRDQMKWARENVACRA